jgi:hypothetical protein
MGYASDPDNLSYALTYGGTLVVALLMFIGQLTAVGIFLVRSRRISECSVRRVQPRLPAAPRFLITYCNPCQASPHDPVGARGSSGEVMPTRFPSRRDALLKLDLNALPL